MQNFDATAATLGQNWFQNTRGLMMDANANAASQMMPGATAPGVMAGAPIMLPPGLSFGGAFATGGIAPGGKVSLVGERGPELIVPSGPAAVVPMAPMPPRAAPLRNTGSAMDRHMSTGLSGQPTRPVGRSITDPQRQLEMAGRRLRSQGDIAGSARLAQSQAWLDARMGGRGPMPMMPMQQQQPPMVPRMPQPGMNAPMNEQPLMPLPAPAPAPAALPMVPEGMNPLTGLPLNDRPPMLPFGTVSQGGQGFPGMAPPPPGLYGEAPPMVSSMAIPGTDQMQPMIQGLPKGGPVAKAQPKPAAEWQPPKMYDEVVPEMKDPADPTKILRPATTRQYYYVQDPKTGKPRKEYALDENGDGVPDNQQPGWMSWLEQQK